MTIQIHSPSKTFVDYNVLFKVTQPEIHSLSKHTFLCACSTHYHCQTLYDMLNIYTAFHQCESSHGSKKVQNIKDYQKGKFKIHTFQHLNAEKCFPQTVQMYRFCPVSLNGLRQYPCWLSRVEGGGRMS